MRKTEFEKGNYKKSGRNTLRKSGECNFRLRKNYTEGTVAICRNTLRKSGECNPKEVIFIDELPNDIVVAIPLESRVSAI